MKNYIPILLVVICLSLQSCAQNENWQELLTNKDSPIHQFDSDFIKFVAQEEVDEEFKNQEKFKFLNSFREMFKINNESLLESEYMIKPTNNELLALYLKRKIGWNSKKSKQAIIYNELNNFSSTNELLSFYYSEIFIQVLNKKDNYSPNEINLDYNKLELSKEEGDIMFLTAMRHCGRQINSFSEARFPNNCFRQTSFVSKLPKFNGMNFDEYQLDQFDDFLIHVDKRHSKISFKERYLPEFERAKSGYAKCQKAESQKEYMSKDQLIGGRWSFPVAENCINFYEFKRDSVEIFDCEIQEMIYGTYEINYSQIIIETLIGQYDAKFPKESRHNHQPKTIELRIDGNMLIEDKHEMEYIKIK